MTDTTDKHPFSADRPIASREEDLLGRSHFAESLASAIKGWKGNESLVIALHGPWGSGKSSIKNMVLEALQHSDKTSHIILQFNPWQWAGHEELAGAFFHEVGLALGRADASKEGKKRTSKWKSYAAYLKAGSFLAGGVRKLITGLLILIGLLGIGGSVIDASWFKMGLLAMGLCSLVLAGLSGWMGTFLEKVAAAIEAGSETGKLELHELKKQIADTLRQLKTPLLLVVDDVDRLSSEEIKVLFQLIKANADFPNLIYLVLFQRDVVEKSLEKVAPITGREFLEKIVQVGFDVPRIERPRLERALFAGLDKLLGRETVGQRFNRQRWQNIFIPGLRPYFETLRDVHRYLATLSFQVSLFQQKGSFNVNPIDLIALEVLRVFEPEIYQVLSENKLVLTGQPTRLSQDWGDETRRFITSIVDKLPESRREQVREVLKELFPKVDWALRNYGYGSGFEDGWFRELRVCHSGVFDRYFHFAVPEGDISQAELDLILSLAGDHEGLVAEFQSFKQTGLLEVALDRLEAYKEKIDLKDARAFVTAIFDIGDDLRTGKSSFFEIEPDIHAIRIIHWYLKQEKDPTKRGQLLRETMKLSTGLYLLIMQTSHEANRQERQQHPDAFLVGEGDLEELKKICLEKIRVAAKNGKLKDHPKMAYILYRWSEWASPDEPKRWVEKLVSTKSGLLSFLKGLLQKSMAQGVDDYATRIYRYMRLKSVEDFVAPEIVEEGMKQISLDELTEEEKEAVRAFQRALKRRREGKPDDEWGRDSEED